MKTTINTFSICECMKRWKEGYSNARRKFLETLISHQANSAVRESHSGRYLQTLILRYVKERRTTGNNNLTEKQENVTGKWQSILSDTLATSLDGYIS